MKRHILLSFLVTMIAVVGFAREPRKVALVVQNHAEPGATLAFMALTDALTARLASCDLQVINPYNSVGINQNRDARGEKTPEVSAMELARRLKADGAVTASVVELRETPPSGDERKFVIHMILNLADAQTGATVFGADVTKTSPKYTVAQIAMHRADYISKLMYAVADECADKLKGNPSLDGWVPTPPPPPPPPPLPPSPPVDPQLTISDTDGAVQNLISAMRTSPVFRANYDKAQKAIARAPLVIVGGFVDLTNGDSPTANIDNLLGAASQNLRMTLVNSNLFDAKDDALITTITKRIIANGNSPLEDGELMSALKQHGSPDFYIVGDLRYFDESRVRVYRFRLALHNMHTGKIVWEGTETIEKKKGASK